MLVTQVFAVKIKQKFVRLIMRDFNELPVPLSHAQ